MARFNHMTGLRAPSVAQSGIMALAAALADRFDVHGGLFQRRRDDLALMLPGRAAMAADRVRVSAAQGRNPT